MKKKEERKYLIIPACDDTNRGDQALIWETATLAAEAGFVGKFYMTAELESSRQSEAHGIGQIDCILPHPSIHFKSQKSNSNVQYGKLLKLQWMLVSLWDCFLALLLLMKPFRSIAKKIYPPKIRRSITIFEEADAAFVKGGGFLHSYGSIVNSYANFYDLYHIMLAQAMHIPVYVLPNSLGPFMSPGTGKMIKHVLQKCEFVSVRESVSKEMVKKELGLDVDVFPDLAFYLKSDDILSATQKEKLNNLPLNQKCVALTVRPYRFPGNPNAQEAYLSYKRSIAEFVRYLSQKGYCPVLVEHTFSKTEHERDMSCIQDVIGLLDDSCEYYVFSDLSLNCRQLKYVYSKFDYIIGTRFHSVIFSLSSGVPAIAISYGGNKGVGIMKDVGLEDYAIRIEDINTDKLIFLFEKMEKEKAEIKSTLAVYQRVCDKKRDELLQRICRKD